MKSLQIGLKTVKASGYLGSLAEFDLVSIATAGFAPLVYLFVCFCFSPRHTGAHT